MVEEKTKIAENVIIDPSARIAENVEIGPWTVIGANVEVGAGSKIGSHVVIKGPTKIGQNNHIYHFCSIGEDPQYIGHQGHETRLDIGDNNIIREFITINRGTDDHGGVTTIGNNNFFMAYVHIAHDCQVGNHTIFANNAGIAGMVHVHDYAFLGAFAGVHQRCFVGAHSFLGRAAKAVKDIPPFIVATGNPCSPSAINKVGLQSRNFSNETIRNLRKAYSILYRQGLKLAEAREQLVVLSAECKEVQLFVDAIDKSTRGIIR